MASIIVGSVSVDVVPNALKFAETLRGQIEGPVDVVGQEVGQNLSDAVVDHLADAIPEGLAAGIPESAEIGDESGARFADAFSTQVRSKIDAALKSLPPVEIDAEITEVEAKLDEIRGGLASLSELANIDITANDDEVIAILTGMSVELEAIRAEAETPIHLQFDAAEAQASLDALLGKIAAVQAAQEELAASTDADRIAEEALAAEMAADIATEHALADSMNSDWEAMTREISGSGGVLSSLNGMAVVLAGLVLLGPPIIGVLGASIAGLVIGAKNAHVETDNLSTSWHNLEAEAGSSIQGGLQKTVNDLAAALPQLSPLVDVLGADIGNALDDMAKWLGSGGAKEIVDYLSTELPIVGHFVEATGAAMFAFFGLLQGPANALMETLTAIFDLFTKIASLGGGTAGTATGGIGGQTNVNGSTFGSQVQHVLNTNAPYQFGSAKTTGDTAADAGHDIVKTANNPFGSLEGGTDGGASKRAKQAASLSKADSISAANQATAASRYGPENYNPIAPSLDSKSLNEATAGLDDNSKALIANAQAAGETIGSYQSAQAAAAQLSATNAQNTANMIAENNAAGLLSQTLGGFGTNQLQVAQTSTQFHASITSLNTSLAQNGATLDENTGKGQQNRAAIEAAVAAAEQHQQAVAKQTDSVQAGTAAYNDDITALEKQLAATGLSKQAIDDYITSIGEVPTDIKTEFEVETASAIAQMKDFANQMNGIAGTITSEAVLRAKANSIQADGSFLQFYADGAHVAQMAPAGAMRVWAEPETGGESYIPHAASKRVRSEAILGETAKLFGGTYIPRNARNAADGLVLSGTGSGSYAGRGGGAEPHSHPINVTLDGKKITKVVNEQNQWNGRL